MDLWFGMPNMTEALIEQIVGWVVSGGGMAAILKVAYDYYQDQKRSEEQLEGVTAAQDSLIDDYESATHYWRDRAEELGEENESIKEQNEILRQQNDLLRREVERKEEENKRLKRKVDELEKRNKMLAEEIERTARYLETLQDHFDHLRGLVQELTKWLPDDKRDRLEDRFGDILQRETSEKDRFTPEADPGEDQ